MRSSKSAYQSLLDYLLPSEEVEAVAFGPYDGYWNVGDDDYSSVPREMQGVVMPLADAEPFLREFRVDTGFGAPCTHPVYVWTNLRVITVGEYDWSTGLCSVPRHPCDGEVRFS